MGWLVNAPAALHSGKRRGTHCIGSSVDPRVGLDGCRKSRPYRDSIPGPKIFTKVKTTFCYSKKGTSYIYFSFTFCSVRRRNSSGVVGMVHVTLLLLNSAI